MLSREDNELLTRVGPSTPMGDLLRRFWFPILLADEIPDPDSDPVRVKVLGEYFVAFRDTAGRLGLLDARCPHRGADLSFGINEEGGIRCRQCAWKFDVDGNILDLPMEPADSPLWKEVKAPAYKISEYGGLVWAYLGPQDDLPDLPEFEWSRVEADQRHVSRFLVECNYWQGVEGGLDASRVAAIGKAGEIDKDDPFAEDVSHTVQAKSTDYGLMIGTSLDAGGNVSPELQVTHWLMPFYTTNPADADGILEGVAWVPIDDESTMAFAVTYNPQRALSKKLLNDIRLGKRVHPQLSEGTVRRAKNKENGFQEKKGKDGTFTPFADRFKTTFEMAIACQESMGTIVDRSQETLSPTDIAIEGARKMLMTAAVDLMEGTIPVIVHKGEAYRVRSYAGELNRAVEFDDDDNIRNGVTAKV
ncbi:MAG: Rieske 2Fe-2S domain-containing protein [Chloroflexi bacterium]|nr:Rieske 2Fe-2S domain-containing protein [Chloroflexota bacterium]